MLFIVMNRTGNKKRNQTCFSDLVLNRCRFRRVAHTVNTPTDANSNCTGANPNAGNPIPIKISAVKKNRNNSAKVTLALRMIIFRLSQPDSFFLALILKLASGPIGTHNAHPTVVTGAKTCRPSTFVEADLRLHKFFKSLFLRVIPFFIKIFCIHGNLLE